MSKKTGNGIFIAFEGIEGCGKSTQAHLLNTTLNKNGIKSIISFEPGGTEIGKKLREVLINPEFKGKLHPVTETLLYQADRNQHLKEKIIPHLEKGYVVICDRYQFSSLAYQGYGRGVNTNIINWIFKNAVQGLMPDITFLIDIDVETSLERVKKRANAQNVELSRFEIEEYEFHQRVREGFLNLAKENNFVIIDGRSTIKEVHQMVLKEFKKRFRIV